MQTKRKMKKINLFYKRERRYLLLMPEYIMGGAETQFRYLINYAEKNQWKLDVIIEHKFHGKSISSTDIFIERGSVRLYEVNKRGADGNKLFWSIIKCIIKNLLQVKYRVCVIYNPADLALAPVIRMIGIRVIYSERGDASCIAGNLYYQKCLQVCDRIVVNSKYAQKKTKKLTNKKVVLIRNGRPAVQKFSYKDNRKICRILVPGRIVPLKNQLILLRYLKKYPNFDGKVIFAGHTSDEKYQKKLMTFVNRNHLQNKVEFLGYVGNIHTEYEKADLIVLPSFTEGTPNVVLEAYAYGRPVIVSDIEQEREVVKDSNFRFRLKSTDGIDRCIKYIENLSDEEYRDLLEHNREFVIKNYSIEKMAEKFYKVLTAKV